jgi:carbon-monoxide dehydrogenase catalytic subunit
MAHALLLLAEGETSSYEIRNPRKLRAVALEYGISIDGKDDRTIAGELAHKMLAEFGQQEGELTFVQRAPEGQQEIWKRLGITPRGVDMEIVEVLGRTHIGVENEYRSLISGAMKASLADGWGGSMIATEVSDILFGAPEPIRAQANLGVLREDQVNVVLHGHVPLLSEVIVDAAQSPDMIALAQEKGASGINVAGICCTANEILMRRGIPVAGSFLQQELAITTGVVDAMVVDVQCIMPSLPAVADCFHTRVISTDPRAHFEGVKHVELDERHALDIAKDIVREGIEAYADRDADQVRIPDEKMDVVAGFTTENTFYNLGGRFRGSFRPLNDAIMAGRLRGVAGVVGCDNPRNSSGGAHVAMVMELIKNDVLVVQTGCSALACGKAGLLRPEAAFEYGGKGLQEVCAAVGIPPVLHLGSCVDNSRILTACTEMVREGGIGNDISELPVAGAAPEWMSEKAIAIGWYFVTSGVFTVFGTPLNVLGSPRVNRYVTDELESIVGGKWGFESDPVLAAHLMIDHINKKRAELHLRPMMYGEE